MTALLSHAIAAKLVIGAVITATIVALSAGAPPASSSNERIARSAANRRSLWERASHPF